MFGAAVTLLSASAGASEVAAAAAEPSALQTLLLAVALVLALYAMYTKFCSSSESDAAATSKAFAAYRAAQVAEETDAGAEEAPAAAAPTRGQLAVYFGSQTGTAEEYANTLAEEGRARGFDAKSVDLEDFEPGMLTSDPKGLHMFVTATYGEGDPTDNAQGFYKWLKQVDELPESLEFCVFGLGNRQYEHFNATGRGINKLLEKKGAQRVHAYGEGDDDGTLEQDFEQWRDHLWPALEEKYGGAAAAVGGAGKTATAAPTWSPSYVVCWINETNGTLSAEDVAARAEKARNVMVSRVLQGIKNHDPDRSVTRSSIQYFQAKRVPIIANIQLRSDGGKDKDDDGDFGSTIRVDVDLASSGMSYETADTLAICPENDPALVETLAQWQNYDLDRHFIHLRPDGVGRRDASIKPLFPSPCTVREALTSYCDITSPVRKPLLPKLAQFATNPSQADRLRWLASAEGRAEFNDWVLSSGRTIIEVLEAFDSVQVPFGAFLELVPRLMSRDYTISSSSVVHPGVASITCKVLRDPKQASERDTGDRYHHGVCSNYLLREGQSCLAFVRTSTFRLPKDPAIPIIMVGPGTGIAPMRAFLQERQHQRESLGESKVGDTYLYFGCRRRSADFIYEDELLQYCQNGTLSSLQLAFSREGTEKVYVQDKMRDTAADLWRLIDEQGAYFYVCGGTSMGKSVKSTLEQIFVETGGLSAETARERLQSMQDTKRYVQELWS